MAGYSINLSRMLNRGSVTSLIFCRTIYAVNWYNVAAVFTFIAHDFSQNVSGLGLLTASFYIGLGIFQVPGGIVAARIGPRKTAICSILLASVAAFLTGFVSDFYQFVILRFFVGMGMALFLGPGVTLMAKCFRQESEGFGVGIFNGVFYVGGSLGLFVWSVFANWAGWRASLVTSGALGVFSAFLLLNYLPREESKSFVIRAADLKKVLADKWLVLLSLELFGIGSGSILITTFMVFYLEQSLKLSPAVAGGIGSLTLLCAVFASPLFGLLYDKTKRARALLFWSGVALAAAIALVSIGNVHFAILSSLIVGLSAGTFTVAYLAAREPHVVSNEYQTLAVAWVNNIQMLAGFWSPVTFSILAVSVGYANSWLIAAAYTFVLISVILWGQRNS